MGELGQFAEGAASWRKVLGTVPADSKLVLFESAAVDFAGYVARGLDRIIAVDELVDIASANGLVDDDVVQEILARAFENIEPEDMVPDLEEAPQTGYTNGKGQHQPNILRASTYLVPDPNDIPPRQWLYGMHYMRGTVTSTVAPGGFGKTSLALYEALSMASNGLRVWYISGEDDKVELDRRIAAHAQRHPTLMPSLANGGVLFLDDKISFPFKIARTGKQGPQFDEERLKAFEQAIADDKIDNVILDPFISFHYLNENDTSSMDAFVKRLAEICVRQQCSIELSHHVRKPGMGQTEITVYDARGAGAIVNAVRSCRVLNQMTSIEAEQAELDPEKRSGYIRIDNGKRNMAPPEKAKWCRLINVTIANGDRVQAVEPWDFPKTFSKLVGDDVDWIKGLLRIKPYRADSRSPDWLGHEICRRFSRDSTGQNKGDIKWCNAILTSLIRINAIKKQEMTDNDSKRRIFYVLAEAVADIIPFPKKPDNKLHGLQVIGPEPNGAVCEHCGKSDETVFLIRNPFKGVASHALHEGCANGFFENASTED